MQKSKDCKCKIPRCLHISHLTKSGMCAFVLKVSSPLQTSFTQSFRWEFLNKWLLQSKNFPSQDHCFWQESLFPPLLPPPSSSFHCHFLSFFLAFLSLTLLRKEHYFTQNQNNSHKKCTDYFLENNQKSKT